MTTTALKRSVITNPAIPDEEAATFFATNEWRYMELRWRPVLPARVWAVLSCLYDHIRFDKQTWEKKEICWPSLGEIAARTRMDERTVRRILHRDAAGRFDYTYRSQIYWIADDEDVTRYVARHEQARAKARTWHQQRQTSFTADVVATAAPSPNTKPIVCPVRPGELIAGDAEEIPDGYAGPVYSLGDLISLFIKDVSPRYHYSQGACQWQRTSNAYRVSAIVPPVPDTRSTNDVLISLADVRTARQKLQAEQAEGQPPLDTRARTNWPVQSADNLSAETSNLKSSQATGSVSILPKVVGPLTIGKNPDQQPGRDNAPTSNQQSNRDDKDATTLTASHHIEQATTAAAPRSLSQTSKNDATPGGETDTLADLLSPLVADTGGARPAPVAAVPVIDELPSTLPASAFLSEGEILRIQADAVIGKAIENVARQVMKDKNARSTRAQVVRALASAHTPLDQLLPALYLGRNRVARYLCAGGKIQKTLPGFFIGTMRNLAKEARGIGYEFARVDTEEHVGHVAEDAGDYAYIQTPTFRNSPQRSINPHPDQAARAAQFRLDLDLADRNRRAYDER